MAKKKKQEICNSFKWGEFNGLHCISPKGHKGEHCYVVQDGCPECGGSMKGAGWLSKCVACTANGLGA